MNSPQQESSQMNPPPTTSSPRRRGYLSSLMNTARNTLTSASQHFTPEEQQKLNECKMIVRNKGVNKVTSIMGMGGKRRRRTKTRKHKSRKHKSRKHKTRGRKSRRRKH